MRGGLGIGTTGAALGAIAVVMSVLRTHGAATAQGAGDLRPRALAMFVAWPLVQGVAVYVACARSGWGVDGAVAAYFLAMAVGALVARRPRGLAGPRASLARVLASAWPAWVQGMLMAAYTWVDHVLLAGVRGAEAAGVYGPVAALAPLFGLGLQALSSVGAPMIARQHAAGDAVGLSREFRRVARMSVLVSAPAFAVCGVAPMAVLGLWTGGSAEAVPALRLVAGAQLFATAVGSVNYFLLMTGRQRGVLWNGVPALVASVGLGLALVPALGVTGAALANAAAALLANGIALVQVRRAGGPWPLDLPMVKVLLAVATGAFLAWLSMAPAAAIASRVALPFLAHLLEVSALAAVAGAGTVAALVALGMEAEDRELLALVAARARGRRAS